MTIGDTTYVRRFFSLYSNEEKDKVRGHAFYPTDYLSALVPNETAYVGVLRSPHTTATFKKIDTSALKSNEDIIEIITAKNIPNNRPFGSGKSRSQLILADGEVRYLGEPIALIVAKTPEALASAQDQIQIDWTVKKPMAPESVFTAKAHHGKLPAKNSKRKLTTLELNFSYPSLQARYLESESGWLRYYDGNFEFHIGALLSESQRTWVSEVLDIPLSAISAKESYLGGQFGGRQQRELIVFLALAASVTKRSVALRFHRREQDTGSYGFSGHMALVLDEDKRTAIALKGSIQMEAGAYEGNARITLEKALEHASSIYDFEALDIEGEVVLTPTFPRRALKGEGLTAITWVVEQLMERAAQHFEMGALEFRGLHVGEDHELSAKVLQEVEKIEKPFKLVPLDRNRPVWAEREIKGRGFGFQVFRPTFMKEFDFSDVTIQLLHSGAFMIRTSNLTLDLHMKAALSEVAATVLKTHPKAFTVEGQMRDLFEKAARRETYPEFYYLAQATWYAADALKKKILVAAAKTMGSKDLELQDGAVLENAGKRKMGYRELAFTHGQADLTASFQLKEIEKPHGCSAGATATVTFHPLTGELRVDSVRMVIDAGPVLYRDGLETQLDASISWAIAALFSSESLEEQPIPTTMDEPQDLSLVTIGYPLKDYADKPPTYFGARGVTSVMMSTVLAALVNAIQNAKEMPLTCIPMSGEFMYPKKRNTVVHTLPFRRNPS